MTARRKPQTMEEQMAARRALLEDIETHPGQPVPQVIRQVRKALRLTLPEYAKVCGISTRGLQDIERGVSSPTLDTVAKLLRPMGLRLSVVTREQVERAASQSNDD